MTFDQATLVRAHFGQGIWSEATQLLDLAGEDGRPGRHAVREDDLDTLPAMTGDDLEDRPDLDDEAGLLEDLARERILDPLARMQKASEESPLRGSEAVTREEDVALLVHSEAGDTDEEAVVRGRHEAPLPPHGERVEKGCQETHEHRRKD